MRIPFSSSSRAVEVVGRAASVVVLPNARARRAGGAVKGIVMSGGAQEHAGKGGEVGCVILVHCMPLITRFVVQTSPLTLT